MWFALTDPDLENKFLGVNLTSFELFKDKTVVLDSGHPFIVKKSVMQFSDAKLFLVSNIDWLIENRHALKKEPCSIELLEIIRSGLLKSDHSPQDMQEYLKRRLV